MEWKKWRGLRKCELTNSPGMNCLNVRLLYKSSQIQELQGNELYERFYRISRNKFDLQSTGRDVFGNPCAVIDSSSTPYQGRHHSGTHYDQVQGNLLQKVKMFSQTLFIAVKTFVVCRSEEQNRHTIPTPSFPRTPSTMNSFFQQKEHIHRITLLINKDFSSLTTSLHLKGFHIGR